MARVRHHRHLPHPRSGITAAPARDDQGRDVVAHLREGIAAALPSIVLVVTSDQVGADVADGEFGKIPRRRPAADGWSVTMLLP